MSPFIPKRFEAIVFGFLLSALMSFFVSFIANAVGVGVMTTGFMFTWTKSWLTSWMFAFPTVLFVAPLVRRLLSRIVKPA